MCVVNVCKCKGWWMLMLTLWNVQMLVEFQLISFLCVCYIGLFLRWSGRAGWPLITSASWREAPRSTGLYSPPRVCPGTRMMRWDRVHVKSLVHTESHGQGVCVCLHVSVSAHSKSWFRVLFAVWAADLMTESSARSISQLLCSVFQRKMQRKRFIKVCNTALQVLVTA